jgi:rod shape determining protein RodA
MGGLLLLVYAAFFLKTSIAGTQRWIDLGFFRLQPSEPAKLALVVVLASYFSRQEIGEGFGLLDLIKPGILTGVPFALIMIQPDLGTAMMLAVLFCSMILFVKLRCRPLPQECGASSRGVLEIPAQEYQRNRMKPFSIPRATP